MNSILAVDLATGEVLGAVPWAWDSDTAALVLPTMGVAFVDVLGATPGPMPAMVVNHAQSQAEHYLVAHWDEWVSVPFDPIIYIAQASGVAWPHMHGSE